MRDRRVVVFPVRIGETFAPPPTSVRVEGGGPDFQVPPGVRFERPTSGRMTVASTPEARLWPELRGPARGKDDAL